MSAPQPVPWEWLGSGIVRANDGAVESLEWEVLDSRRLMRALVDADDAIVYGGETEQRVKDWGAAVEAIRDHVDFWQGDK